MDRQPGQTERLIDQRRIGEVIALAQRSRWDGNGWSSTDFVVEFALALFATPFGFEHGDALVAFTDAFAFPCSFFG